MSSQVDGTIIVERGLVSQRMNEIDALVRQEVPPEVVAAPLRTTADENAVDAHLEHLQEQCGVDRARATDAYRPVVRGSLVPLDAGEVGSAVGTPVAK